MINDSVANIGIQPGDRQLNVQAIQQHRPGQGFHAVPMPQRVSATLLKFHFPAPKNRLTRTQPLMRAVVTSLVITSSTIAAPAFAQKEIPKAPGHDQCPLGYVNTLGTTCVSPIYYEVAPTNGGACLEGWMNIGAGYCKKKKGPLGIL